MKYDLRENYYALFLAVDKGFYPERAFVELYCGGEYSGYVTPKKTNEGCVPLEYIPQKDGHRVCKKCFQELPEDEFYNRKNAKCKPCARAEARGRQRGGKP